MFYENDLSQELNGFAKFSEIILWYSNYFEIIGNIKFGMYNKSILYNDKSDNLFESKYIIESIFNSEWVEYLNIIQKYYTSILIEHLKGDESTDKKVELCKQAWITLLNKKKLYENGKDLYPDYTYTFFDFFQRTAKVILMTYK